MEQKGTRYVPYSLIAVHEEAGDECAHAQLIANRFRLQYRGTSLLRPAERLELFRRQSHGCELGLSSPSGLL
jgi:hypothetical protein